MTPLSILVARFIASATHKFFEAQAAIRGEQTAMINELVEGQRVVKAFGLEEEKLAEFGKKPEIPTDYENIDETLQKLTRDYHRSTGS